MLMQDSGITVPGSAYVGTYMYSAPVRGSHSVDANALAYIGHVRLTEITIDCRSSNWRSLLRSGKSYLNISRMTQTLWEPLSVMPRPDVRWQLIVTSCRTTASALQQILGEGPAHSTLPHDLCPGCNRTCPAGRTPRASSPCLRFRSIDKTPTTAAPGDGTGVHHALVNIISDG